MAGFLRKLLLGRKKNEFFCCALVPAAGSASRMQGLDKILMPLGDQPLLAHTLRQLEECPLIREIIVVTRNDLIVEIGQLCRDYSFQKVSKVIVGGDTRMKSVYAGLQEIPRQTDLIAIHDGARPFVTQELLEEVILRGAECGAAAPALPIKDTVKRARQGMVEETLERGELFSVQTPQVFETSLIKAAISKAIREKAELTDDCTAVERLGMKVALTTGNESNIKITTPADLLLAEVILEGRES